MNVTRPTFRLKSLLLTVAIFALVIYGIRVGLYSLKRGWATNKLLNDGGQIVDLTNNHIGVVLSGNSFSDEHIALVRDLANVHTIGLVSDNISDQGLQFLEGMPIFELVIDCPMVTPTVVGKVSASSAVRSMSLGGGHVTDSYIETACPQSLESLQLVGTRFSSDAFTAIEQLPKLTSLEILGRGSKGSVDIRFTKNSRNLRFLKLSHVSISSSGLVHLELLRSLTGLCLERVNCTESDLLSIWDMTRLDYLAISDMPISDEAVKDVGKLYRLQQLDLSSTAIGDSSMELIARLPELHSLDISATSVSSEGLHSLAQSKSLRKIAVTKGDRISQRAIDRLQAHLPQCYIRSVGAENGGK